MNQIKKLELVGFKSFCDRTHIPFHEGVTAIVGPNGCGKSNIADAISWVVGEQSAKALRTGKMEEVIFNGTEKRKATGFAEVLLTLSMDTVVELSGFPDLDPNEFTVGRRLYRSGESEYYLDGHRCRLRDLQTLLEGTGLGPNSYAILEQGRVGQILSSKPAERRSLIEEAARTTLFTSRRYAAEAKLEQAQQNLARVQDVIQEVTRQLNSLRRQAEKARAYNRRREELRSVHKLKICLEERQLRHKLTECSNRFHSAREQEQALMSELTATENTRGGARKECEVYEETVNRLRERHAALKMEANNARNAFESQGFQKQGFIARVGELDREQGSINEREQTIQREIERLTEASRVIAEEIVREKLAVEAEQDKNEKLHETIRGTENQIDELRRFLAKGAVDVSDLKNQQARCQENLRRIADRTNRLESERQIKAEENMARKTELSQARGNFERKSRRKEELAVECAELESGLRLLAARIEEVSAEVSARTIEQGGMRQRLSALEDIERQRSNYSEGVQKFLSTRLPGEEASQVQTLADHIEANPAYESALEDYLNSPLQYILVDSRDDAVNGVERLRRVGAGKCTFMTLRNVRSFQAGVRPQLTDGDGVIGYLDDLLLMNPEIKQAFERALPEYASTVLVNDLNTAFRVSEQVGGGNFLTLSGESYSPRGTLSAVGEKKSMTGFLALKREKRELEKKLAALHVKIEAGRAELANLKQEHAVKTEELKTLTAESHELKTEIALAGQEISRLEKDLERIDQSEQAATAELEQLSEEKTGYEKRMADAAGRIAEIESHRGQSDETLHELNARLQSLRTESATQAKELGLLVSSHAVKQERKSGIEADLRRLQQETGNLRRRAEENRSEAAQIAERIRELENTRSEIETRVAAYDRDIQEASAELEEKQQALSTARAALETVEARLKKTHEVREETLNTRGRIEIEKTRLESDLEHLERNCQDEFHIPVAELIPDIPDEDWAMDYQEVSESCEQLRNKIENFGAINMRALEEYQEVDQHYQHLHSQRSDVEKAILDIQTAIADITQRSVKQFKEAYDAIRQNFHEVFQILFGGGQCDIRLLDETNILESGIDITAQPPGKKLQNVLLLSGGERALTALALLIAIFRYRPSPVCVLDEVDAPLDETNVGRFAKMLMELSGSTQFIIITHNKNTMKAADVMYGITMEEPGISKVLSVDFRPLQAVPD